MRAHTSLLVLMPAVVFVVLVSLGTSFTIFSMIGPASAVLQDENSGTCTARCCGIFSEAASFFATSSEVGPKARLRSSTALHREMPP